MAERIPTSFLTYASGILADTSKGLSGSKMVEIICGYAADHDVHVPHSSYPFDSPNKRTALRENLEAFAPHVQFEIIKDLCEMPDFKDNVHAKDLKIKLVSLYGYLDATAASEAVTRPLIQETSHWLEDFPDAFKLYLDAEQKYRGGIYTRNLLDDLRLALELLLKGILENAKSLENQVSPLGQFLKDKGGSKELRGMFLQMFEYYTKYNNSYVKHDDAVPEQEVEIMFELTSSFIKHLIRLNEGA
jgi:hypothetical protein